MEGQNQKHLMFVYGTLKKGEPNYDLMTDPMNGTSRFLGKGFTANKHPLVIGTQYNVPFLLKVPGKGHEIEGELYEVDQQMCEFLDYFEGHPHMYTREKISIRQAEDDSGQALTPNREITCWTYFLSKVKEDFLSLKVWKKFNSISDDHQPYTSRSCRPVPLMTLLFPEEVKN